MESCYGALSRTGCVVKANIDLCEPGADAEDEASLGQMIEHRRMGGDQHRVRLRQVGRAGRHLICVVSGMSVARN